MKLEAGKRYLTKDGTVVGPLWKEDEDTFAFNIDVGKEVIEWNEEGRVIYYGGTGSNFRDEEDLVIIREYVEGNSSPVITVKFRTIVPGTYGNLEVLNYITTGHDDVMKQKVTFKVSECVLDCNELEKLVNDLSEILDVLKEAQKNLEHINA